MTTTIEMRDDEKDPLAGWLIARWGPLFVIGKPSNSVAALAAPGEAVLLASAYELITGSMMTESNTVAVRREAYPLLTSAEASEQQWCEPPFIPVASLALSFRLQLLSAVESAVYTVERMKRREPEYVQHVLKQRRDAERDRKIQEQMDAQAGKPRTLQFDPRKPKLVT